MAYKRKTYDEFQLLGNWGYGDGWEYILAEDTLAEVKKRRKEYLENDPSATYKIVKRRIKIEEKK